MRFRFRQYCRDNPNEYELFLPEAAMENVLSGDAVEPFDIADFESLVGDLSHAIVVFPEAPGSFAETGYFSAIQDLAQKSVLVLDRKRQRDDSFISLGPAKKIGELTVFHPIIQMDYDNPDFDTIIERIRRINPKTYKKSLSIAAFRELTTYELASLIHEIVQILSIATLDDIIFILRGLFKGQISVQKTKKVVSILVGAKYLVQIGEFGHIATNKSKEQLLELKDGYKESEREIKLSLAVIYEKYDPEFVSLIVESRDVD